MSSPLAPTWTDRGFNKSDFIPTSIRPAAANQGATYMAGRTPIISLQLRGRHLWMSFLVVENLDKSEQFFLVRDFLRNFDVIIDLKDGLIRIMDPEKKCEKKPVNKILTNQAKVPIFLDRKMRSKQNQAVVATFIIYSERTMCECVVKHTGNMSDDTKWTKAWICVVSEQRMSECGELEKV